MYITRGIFEDMTVNQVVAIANTILGNVSTKYSSSDVNATLISINSNYVDGTDLNFLRCSGKTTGIKPNLGTKVVSYVVYPNPVKDIASIEFVLSNDTNVEILLYNMNGQLLNSIFKGAVTSGEKNSVKLEAETLKSGVYFLKLMSDSEVVTKSIIIGQ